MILNVPIPLSPRHEFVNNRRIFALPKKGRRREEIWGKLVKTQFSSPNPFQGFLLGLI